MMQLDHKVGLILLDVNLGGENGLQLLDFIKLNHPDLPVILYTGMTHDNEQVRAMLDRAANCYVTKGQPFHDLLSAINAIRR
jgi:DNA-binding response OmpR family regulator